MLWQGVVAQFTICPNESPESVAGLVTLDSYKRGKRTHILQCRRLPHVALCVNWPLGLQLVQLALNLRRELICITAGDGHPESEAQLDPTI